MTPIPRFPSGGGARAHEQRALPGACERPDADIASPDADERRGPAQPAANLEHGTPGGIAVVLVPAAMFLLVTVMCFLHLGRFVELFYPVLCLLIAAWLYRLHPAQYLGFLCWVFFLTPEVRRLADFFDGAFNPVSTIMVAPLICTAICGLVLVTDARILGQRRSVSLLLMMLSLGYAYLVGVARAGFSSATVALVTAILPSLIGFRLVATWAEFPNYKRVLLRTFVFASILVGGYGVFEFFSPPPWDAFWLIASGMHSEGDPVPFGMRVGSTMNSSGPFANAMMVCILMSLAGKGKLRIAAAIAIPALMFTSVRSAWGGLVVGLIYPIAMLDGSSRRKLLGAALVCVVLCVPVTMIDQVSEHFTSRLQTVSDLSEDDSFQARTGMYSSFIEDGLTDIAGQGFGTTGIASKLADSGTKTVSTFDSGLMEIPYLMGWPGTLLYVAGVVGLVSRAFSASRRRPKDHFGACGVGVAVAILAMMVFSDTLVGITGMFFMIGVLMPVNGLRYARALHEGTLPRRPDAPRSPRAPVRETNQLRRAGQVPARTGAVS